MASESKLEIVNPAAILARRTLKITTLATIMALGLLRAPVLAQSAPDLTGNWQGTVEAGRGFRVIVQISRADESHAVKGAWQGVFYTIGPSGVRESDVSLMTLDATTLRFAIPDGSFEGKLSADGKTVAGILKQGAASYALTLTRATADTAWAVPKPTDQMPPDAKPEFEVATIKPSPPEWNSSGFKNEGRRIWCENETVDEIIAFAYGIHPKQIVGGPAWLGTSFYTADGFPDIAGEPNYRQMQNMYRGLLASRFNLAFHHETRELSAYVIRLGKGEPKLAKSLADPARLPDTTFTEWNSQAITFRGTNATMADVAWNMGLALDKPFVDQTGLTGRYDFVLRWSPDTARPDNPNAPPNVFTAMQEQLGLKLEATKAPVDVLVIDHVDRPSEN